MNRRLGRKGNKMGIPLRVLIIEDSEDDTELLVRELRRGGYDPTYERVDTPETMKAALDRQAWDIVFADYTMPYFRGTDALKLLKEKGLDLPFIFVSGTIGEDLAVEAMKAGAHDYFLKGNLKRLIPAVVRELRDAETRRGRKQAEEALERLRHQNELILKSAGEGIYGLDAQANITFVNPAAARMLGYEVGELIGRSILTLLHPPKSEASPYSPERYPIYASLKDGTTHQVTDEVFWKKDGTGFPVEYVATPIRERGQVVGTVVVFKDITEHKVQDAILEYQATHDTLTGIPNRTLLHDSLQQEILAGQRDEEPVALLLMDLDRFKEINDTLGHHHGDLLLKLVGPRLRSCLRESDTVARLGGDEFAVVLPAADIEGATLAAGKILKALEAPFVLEGLPIHVKASIGIALCPDHGEDANSLLQRADVAMYLAKQRGSGYAVYAPEQDQYSPRRFVLMAEFRHAIERNQLFLLYQPKVSMKTRRVEGVEALVRWRQPHMGIIPPDQFVSLAEQTGLIKPLTLWVLGEALKQCHAWHQAGFEITVAVNLSTKNLLDSQFPEQVAGLLETLHIETRWLELEVTESAVMADPSHAIGILNRLSKIGVKLSIDDFGAGYSSLNYVKRLPVQTIKIDKSFVSDLAADEDALIVRSAIELAHNLGLQVVAEGVENQETWDRLAALGCDAAQGNYMCNPIPAVEIPRWLSESPWGLKELPGRGEI